MGIFSPNIKVTHNGDVLKGNNVSLNKRDSSISINDKTESESDRDTLQAKQNYDDDIEKNKIFLIHGHSEHWKEVKNLLEGWNLEAVELSEQASGGMTLIEKFESFANQCCFAIAVFTFDDIVHKENDLYFQVRPNVIFELGWFYAKLGRKKTFIIEEICSNGEIFSDIQGVYRSRFEKSINEIRSDIEKNLRDAGILT
ncbi:MAG: nucleotide-binding protein [Lachnospiraceae bacterium]|nr:nucleotide-binding protein [Lachnospiraceae bacterium]